MPLTRIALRAGKPAEYRKALTESIQRSLVDIFNVPKDDIFMLITEHDAAQFCLRQAVSEHRAQRRFRRDSDHGEQHAHARAEEGAV